METLGHHFVHSIIFILTNGNCWWGLASWTQRRAESYKNESRI